MAEIEFLHADPDTAALSAIDASAHERGTLLRRHLPTTVAAGLWTLAAVLCVIAPFRELFSQNESGQIEGMDGWGRTFVHDPLGQALIPAGFHGTRYGVVLVVCAVVCAALAIIVATFAWQAPRWTQTSRGQAIVRRGLPGLGLAAFGTVAGTGMAALLDAMASRDRFNAAVSGVTDNAAALGVSFRIGSAPWVTLGAAAAALAASLAAFVSPPEEAAEFSPAPTMPDEAPIYAVPHEDDEVLGE